MSTTVPRELQLQVGEVAPQGLERAGLRPWAAELGGPLPGDPGRRHESASAPRIDFTAELANALLAAADAALPQEACGLLLGCPLPRVTGGPPGVRIAEWVQARNVTSEPAQDRYEVHPEDFLAADERARSLGLEIVGVWHSHPESGPIPSKTDFERSWPGWSYLIAGAPSAIAENESPQARLRSWRRSGDAGPFLEERLSSGPLDPAAE